MRIDDMTIDQLKELGRIIQDRINYLYDKQDAEMMRVQHTGNMVIFMDKYGEEHFVRVIEKKRKTINVMNATGRMWNVPAGMAHLVKEQELTAASRIDRLRCCELLNSNGN